MLVIGEDLRIDYPIIDADAHVNEPPDLWQERVPSHLKERAPPADPTGLAAYDGIAWRSSRTGRIRERIMRNAAGTEIPVTLAETIVLDDPEATCRAALLGLGVTLLAVCHALPHLERGALVRLVPQWYSDGGPISIYYASRTLQSM